MRKYYNGCEKNLAGSVISHGPHIEVTVVAVIGKKGKNRNTLI